MNPAVQREARINEAEVAADEEEEIFVSPPLEPFAGGGGGNIWKQERATDNQSTLSRVLDILKSVAFGSDLTRFQIPVQLNMPKSQLQLYGESVYCVSDNLLDACAKGSTPLERFLRVIAWHISTTRLAPFGQTPFNPILGETHHVSCGNLNVFLEQVSHHPPISALYATNEPANLRLQWWQNPVPRFYGHKVEVVIQGKRELWLDAHKEVYEMTSPNLMIQFFPTFGNEWVGSTTIKCSASDLEATLIFHSRPFYVWWGSIGQITGRVLKSSNQALLHEISGFYNQVVNIEDVNTRESRVLFDAQKSLGNLKSVRILNRKSIKDTESLIIWRKVMKGIMTRNWELATKAKHEIEEKQRNLVKERKRQGVSWTPKYFELVDGGRDWQWKHAGKPVTDAPLIVPMDHLPLL